MEPSTAVEPGIVRWWRRSIGGLPRPFWYLWSGQLVNRLGYFLEPFLTLYLVRGRDLPPTTAGAVIAAFGAGAFASQPLGGWMADRFGRRFTLVTGMVATAASLLVLGAVQPIWALAPAAVAAGLSIDLYRPAVAALVADLVSPADRPRAFGLLYWAVNLGVSIAGVLGGVLASHGYWLLFVLDAATCLVFALIILRGVPETRPERKAGDKHGYGAALRDRLLIALSAINLVGAAVYMQCFITLPLVITGDGLGTTGYGIAYAVNPIAVILLQPLTLRWLAGLPLLRVYAASTTLIGIGFGLTAFADSVLEYGATVLVWTLGEIAFNAVAPTLIAEIAPPELRGRYNGVLGTSFGVAALVAPLVGTATLEHFGGNVLWGGCLVVCVLAAGAVLTLSPSLARRRAAMVA
jgi:MFS family permease